MTRRRILKALLALPLLSVLRKIPERDLEVETLRWLSAAPPLRAWKGYRLPMPE